MKSSLTRFVSCLTAVGIAGPALAQSFSDSYVIGPDEASGEYETTTLNSQPAGLTTPGFANGGYTGGTGTSQFAATTSGLNYPAFTGSGTGDTNSGKVNYNRTGVDNFSRSVARNLVGVPDVSEYWMSILVNRGDNPTAADGDGGVVAGFGNTVFPFNNQSGNTTTAGFSQGVYVGFSEDAEGTSFGDLVIKSRNTAAQSVNDTILVDGSVSSTLGTTYNVVMKITPNVGGGSTDIIDWWLNPDNFASEALLTAGADASGSFASFAIGAGGGDDAFARLQYASYNTDIGAFFDEPILATSLADIAAFTGGPVPEPATAGLFVAALAGLSLRRRRA